MISIYEQPNLSSTHIILVLVLKYIHLSNISVQIVVVFDLGMFTLLHLNMGMDL